MNGVQWIGAGILTIIALGCLFDVLAWLQDRKRLSIDDC